MVAKQQLIDAHRLVAEALTARGKRHKILDDLDTAMAPKSATSTAIPFIHSSKPERKVWSVVLEPETEDADGHVISEAEIEKAAHRFLAVCKANTSFDVHHDRSSPPIVPIECYCAPSEFWLGDQLVKKGSWVLGVQINDPDIWAMVESGELTGMSMESLAALSDDEEDTE